MGIDLEKLGISKRASRGELRYCCPECIRRSSDKTPDTDYHLYVNDATKLFFCHRCSFRGHVNSVTEIVCDDILESTLAALMEVDSQERSSVVRKESFYDLDEVVYPLALPATSRPISKRDVAYQYLIDRGYTWDEINYWGIRLDQGFQCPRILFPDYRNRSPVYWVTRKYIQGDNSPKYMNGGFKWVCPNCKLPSNCTRSRPQDCTKCGSVLQDLNSEARTRGYLFGLFRRIEEGSLQNIRTVILTEGLTSMMSTPGNSIASLGKNLTERQMEVLISLDVEICFALDNDALKQILMYADAIQQAGRPLSILPMTKNEDPGVVGRFGMAERFDKRLIVRCAEDILDISLAFS